MAVKKDKGEEKTSSPPAGASSCGGIYDVTESGVHLRHLPKLLPTPKDGEEFLERFREGFELNILERPDPDTLIFELKNVDVSFANALRRIMIAEVPTVCIEHVFMWNNSSIVHDEVLAHRIGLVPLKCDARLFDDRLGEDDEATSRNTVVFKLEIGCGKSKEADEKKAEKEKRMVAKSKSNNGGTSMDLVEEKGDKKDDSILNQPDLDRAASESADLYQKTTQIQSESVAEAVETPGRPYTRHVYSGDIVWVPQGDQAERFPNGIRPVHEDILLAKLRPGQIMEMEMHGRRGIGADHAKFSPVATAAYRLMPHIEILKPIYDEVAEELVNLYEPGVFKLEQCTGGEVGEGGRPHKVKAVLHNPYACTMSRNFMRHEVLKDSIKISRIPNHFIFSVESVGMMPPGVILAEALRVLQEKCRNLVRLLDESLEAEGLND